MVVTGNFANLPLAYEDSQLSSQGRMTSFGATTIVSAWLHALESFGISGFPALGSR